MLPFVVIVNGKTGNLEIVRFDEIKKGDVFSVNGTCLVCGEEPHQSGDADYEGWVLYDEDGNSWFPEDLDR